MLYTTADLITSIKTRAMVPLNQQTILPSSLLNVLTEELYMKILPLVQMAGSEFYLTTLDIAATATNRFDIPCRSIGHGVRSVWRVDSQGEQIKLNRIDPSDAPSKLTVDTPSSFWFEGNTLVLDATINTSTVAYIRIVYYTRPSRLIETTYCAAVTNVSGATVTVSTKPNAMVDGSLVDFVKGTEPYVGVSIDQTIASSSPTSMTFSSLSASVAIGDYVCPAGYSCLPQVPFEFLPLLSLLGTATVLKVVGDAQGAAMAEDKYKELKQDCFSLVSPRDSEEPRYFFPVEF